MRRCLYALAWEHDLRGTILLAHEGINGSVSGTQNAIDALLAYLSSFPAIHNLDHKESPVDQHPFAKFWVKLKREIVTFGVPSANPSVEVGQYVKPENWNDLISQPDVLLIDTRNDYEIEAGTFPGAINPHTESFGQFPDYVHQNLDPARHKRVAMFCTGGIRCEKATSFLLQQGFENVYHLEGGILKYIEEVPKDESLWKGDCFVFDDRRAVDHNLKKASS